MSHRRAVLDTNVMVSALLFRGELSRLHALWKTKAFTIAASREIVEEYLRVLAYPKFNLTEKEIKDIIQEELLPYIEPVMVAGKLKGVCVDPDDDKFLYCAEAAKADVVVSGDEHLLRLKKYKGCPIITAEKFLRENLGRVKRRTSPTSG
ncbi:MAG: putative toxin-antitoxin system toxin component, PIN family [Deltaproteobacteria bacterium]|nr:putative toxin-antitoxin system toxin component, PIN family [Deltaproteobacteria bacterium]